MEGQGQGREGQGQGLNLWDCVEDGKALLRSCCLCVEDGKALLRSCYLCGVGRQGAPAELLAVWCRAIGAFG